MKAIQLFWYLIRIIKKSETETPRHTHTLKKQMKRERSVPKLVRFCKNYWLLNSSNSAETVVIQEFVIPSSPKVSTGKGLKYREHLHKEYSIFFSIVIFK